MLTFETKSKSGQLKTHRCIIDAIDDDTRGLIYIYYKGNMMGAFDTHLFKLLGEVKIHLRGKSNAIYDDLTLKIKNHLKKNIKKDI